MRDENDSQDAGPDLPPRFSRWDGLACLFLLVFVLCCTLMGLSPHGPVREALAFVALATMVMIVGLGGAAWLHDRRAATRKDKR